MNDADVGHRSSHQSVHRMCPAVNRASCADQWSTSCHCEMLRHHLRHTSDGINCTHNLSGCFPGEQGLADVNLIFLVCSFLMYACSQTGINFQCRPVPPSFLQTSPVPSSVLSIFIANQPRLINCILWFTSDLRRHCKRNHQKYFFQGMQDMSALVK